MAQSFRISTYLATAISTNLLSQNPHKIEEKNLINQGRQFTDIEMSPQPGTSTLVAKNNSQRTEKKDIIDIYPTREHAHENLQTKQERQLPAKHKDRDNKTT